MLECCDVIHWLIFRQSQYDNTVATVRVTDTTPRPKNEELPVKRTTSSVGRADG